MRLILLAGCFAAQMAGQTPAPSPQTGNPGSEAPRPQENLSEKLDKQKGVIHPPSDIDPEIAKPAPETPATTPVIPPRAPGAK